MRASSAISSSSFYFNILPPCSVYCTVHAYFAFSFFLFGVVDVGRGESEREREKKKRYTFKKR